MKKICIVTSGQPSANPRVVKEATALFAAGYQVTVIYTPISRWADNFDQQIFSDAPGIVWIKAGYHSTHQVIKYRLARLRRKFYDFLFNQNILLHKYPENAIALFSQELKKKAKHIKADLYIAHNLGALPAAIQAAKKFNSLAAFDAEDFHRGEDETGSLHYQISKIIEDKNLQYVSYITAASPLIADRYSRLYPNLNIITINNVFSKKYLKLVSPSNNNTGLSLFWFSQKLGERRGIEDIIKALNILDCNISFNLLGSCTDEYKNKLMRLADNPQNLHFFEQVSLEKIFDVAYKIDIGIASEISYCENRDICLTNKIFTYLLAGNCILASDTVAQKQFLNEYSNIGLLYDQSNVNDIADKIYKLYSDRELVNKCRNASYELAATKYNWEIESKKILHTINNLFSKN